MADTNLADLKKHIDLVELVSATVELRFNGRNHVGLCPFHNENTPSFNVNDEGFKCFGCGVKGDCIDWVQRIQGVTFREAIKLLGAGEVSITKREPVAHNSCPVNFSDVNAILATNKAMRFNALTCDRFAVAAVEKFGLTHASRYGYTYSEARAYAGLVVLNAEGQWFNRYRDRIMIPLENRSGDILGFAGRSVSTDARAPKYLNPLASNAFQKKRYLFGLKHLSPTPHTIILVEGLIDCIQLIDAGVPNVVSSMGCDLSDEQFNIIEHYAKRLIVMYDGDMAGLLGAVKIAQRALNTELRIDVCLLSDADPEDFLKANGKAAFRTLPMIPATDFLETRLMANAVKGEWDRTLLDELSAKFVQDNIDKGWPHYNQIDWVMSAYPHYAPAIKKAMRDMTTDHDVINDKKCFKKARILAFLREWAKPCKAVRTAHER